MKIDIDIADYLSHDDKVRLAEDLFKEELRKGFLSNGDNIRNTENYERVIYNAVHHFLSKEVDSIIGKDHKELINNKVKETLRKDLSYTVFRNISPWNDKKSVAQEMLDNIVIENKDIAEIKVKEAMNNINFDNLDDYFGEVLKEAILEKLKQ